jgi:hypothetical protein
MRFRKDLTYNHVCLFNQEKFVIKVNLIKIILIFCFISFILVVVCCICFVIIFVCRFRKNKGQGRGNSTVLYHRPIIGLVLLLLGIQNVCFFLKNFNYNLVFINLFLAFNIYLFFDFLILIVG